VADRFRSARRGGTTVVAGHRRLTQWFRAADVNTSVTLAASTAVLDQSLAGITEPITAVRCRGSIWVGSDQEASEEIWLGAVGMAVVTDQALAAGVGSVPTPITDKDSDSWIMHRYFSGKFLIASGVGIESQGYFEFEFDSKAMRKIPEGSTLIWVVENAGTVGLEYILQFAVLVKLA